MELSSLVSLSFSDTVNKSLLNELHRVCSVTFLQLETSLTVKQRSRWTCLRVIAVWMKPVRLQRAAEQVHTWKSQSQIYIFFDKQCSLLHGQIGLLDKTSVEVWKRLIISDHVMFRNLLVGNGRSFRPNCCMFFPLKKKKLNFKGFNTHRTKKIR